ncbi:MAG TPA: adenylate/guanylate cyclase domain-containing protein, partial [Chloroflexi bacterium]|nr:adenylate/guanylate cyclase domain-containing protein [Chloroflexota bacterium]
MGTPLTFLFTDLENSTQLWEHFPDKMHSAMARHDALISDAIKKHNGRIVKSTGDGFHAVFESAFDGLQAALESQQSLGAETWPQATGPLRVRMGLHTGDSQARDGDYFGPTLNRAARV